MNGLFNSSNLSNENITAIITELSSLTQPKKYDSLMAGNIKASRQILKNVVFYNKKFANSRETVSANIEVRERFDKAFLICFQSQSRLLDGATLLMFFNRWTWTRLKSHFSSLSAFRNYISSLKVWL